MDTTGGQQVPPIPQRVVGSYHLLAQLGQTPTGPVYLARLQHKEALFALKLLPPLGPDDMQRMRHDASLLARVEHPGVVRPIDLGNDRGRAYVVTEHVPGTTLREQLDRRGPLPPRQAARVAADVADALQAIHDAGAVHRHLDPTVIVVDGRDGRAKVTELAVARDPRRPALPGQAPYLPFCMAPEQLRGERAEARSDVYALGAVLYELLSGSPPFEGQSWSELSQEIQAGDPEPPSELVAGIPRAIERACLEALSLAPAQRPTAAELAQELRRAAGGDHERASSPVAVVGLALALVGLVAAVGWGVWERRGRAAAEAALTGERVDNEGLRRELLANKSLNDEAVSKLTEERDRAVRAGKDLDASLSQVRAELARARTSADEVRRGYEQRLEQAAQGALLSPQLGPMVDALIAAIEPAPELVTLRARLLRDRGRVDDLKQLLAAERARGPLPPALAYLELSTQPEQARAQEIVAELAALEEDSPYGAIGRLYSQQQQSGVALQLLQKAYQKAPDDPDVLALLTEFMGRMATQGNNRQALQQALQLADQAVRRNPTSIGVLMERSRLLMFAAQVMQRGEYASRGAADLAAARALSDAALLWNETARAYLGMGQPDLAAAAIVEARRRAQAQNNQNELARTFVLMGLARLTTGDENGAAAAWMEGLRMHPNQQATYDFAPFLAQLGPDARTRVINAAPPQVRSRLEDMLRQAQPGGR